MARTAYKTAINKTAATLAELGPGLVTGHVRWENGKAYMLVKATATAIADGAVCMSEIGQAVANTATTADLTVKVTTGGGVVAVCANNTGASVAASFYFWGIVWGRGYGLAGGVLDADGLELTSAAAGNIALLTGPTGNNVGYGITDTAASAVNSVFWSLPSKRAQA